MFYLHVYNCFSGCGKTLQAISCMLHFRQHWPALIIVPSSLLKQWPDEIKKYAGDVVKASDIRVVGKSTDISTGLITIITYKVMDNLVAGKLISPDQFGVVIADESHNLKNKDTNRSGAILPFLKKANVAICMTGTPAVNRPVELYSQLNGILPDVFCDYNQFVHRYCDAKPHKSLPGLNVSGSSNEAELNLLLNALVMIRRTKADVLSSLPEKRRELRYVEPDPECIPEIRRITARSKKLDEQLANPMGKDNAEIQAMNNEKQQLLTALYTVTGTAKIPSIKEELVKLIEESRRERGIIEVFSTEDANAATDVAELSSDDVIVLDDDSSNDGSDSEATALVDATKKTTRNDFFKPTKASFKTSDHHNGAMTVMEIEDDIVNTIDLTTSSTTSKCNNILFEDLCSENEATIVVNTAAAGTTTATNVPQQRALGKRARDLTKTQGSDDDDAYCTLNSDNDCTFNIRDIKAGRTGKKSALRQGSIERKTVKEEEEENDIMFGVFEQRRANQSKKKKSAKGNSCAPAAKATTSASAKIASPTGKKVESVGQKIIVFFHHKTVLGAIEDSLVEMKVKFIKIDGSTTQVKRAKLIDEFQNDNVV